ncbi:MAG: hypothetical protein MUF01_14285 [Bryobacterales bacterium]|jgi:hypothetical protein|nr:hypothetical protein [Bryobacterales bacterium]
MQTQSSLVRCGNCGAESRLPFLLHAEEQEPPDLDTRPGEQLRSSVGLWMARCPFCGYCAADISTIHEQAGAVVDSAAYQQQLDDARFPAKANEFICHALVLEHVLQYADAGWTMLHAAWVCDDHQRADAASLCRKGALNAWTVGKKHGQTFHDTYASEFLIVSDLHRRMGEFEHALIACNEGQDTEEVPELLDHCFRLQRSLIARKDVGRGSLRQLSIYRGAGSPPGDLLS